MGDFDDLPELPREATSTLDDADMERCFLSPSTDMELFADDENWIDQPPSCKGTEFDSDNEITRAGKRKSLSSSSRLSSMSGSDAGAQTEGESQNDPSGTESETESEEEFEDLDRTVALQFTTPRRPLLWPNHPVGPHESPAPNNFFADAFYTSQPTSSLPFASPPISGINAITPAPTIPQLTKTHEDITSIDLESLQRIEREDLPDEHNAVQEQLLAETQSEESTQETTVERFLDFSPEKRIGLRQPPYASESSPTKTPDRIKVVKNRSRKIPRRPVSPAKTTIAALLEQVASTVSFEVPTVLTREERRAERRRRETRELRQFSEIDLSALTKQKSKMRCDTVMEEEEVTLGKEVNGERSLATAYETERPTCVDEGSAAVNSEQHPNLDAKSSATEEDSAKQEPSEVEMQVLREHTNEAGNITASRPEESLRRLPRRRVSMPSLHTLSSQAPLAGHDERDEQVDFPALARLRHESTVIPHLEKQVESLEGKLEQVKLLLQITKNALHAERRARLDAEATREFLELERQFGVCCASRREEELRRLAAESQPVSRRRPNTSSAPSFDATGVRKVDSEDAPKRPTESRKHGQISAQVHRPLRVPHSTTTHSEAAPSLREKRVLGQNTGNVILNSSSTGSRPGAIRTKGTTGQSHKVHPYSTGPVRAIRRVEKDTSVAKAPRR